MSLYKYGVQQLIKIIIYNYKTQPTHQLLSRNLTFLPKDLDLCLWIFSQFKFQIQQKNSSMVRLLC